MKVKFDIYNINNNKMIQKQNIIINKIYNNPIMEYQGLFFNASANLNFFLKKSLVLPPFSENKIIYMNNKIGENYI